jgi:hypothetical protein
MATAVFVGVVLGFVLGAIVVSGFKINKKG